MHAHTHAQTRTHNAHPRLPTQHAARTTKHTRTYVWPGSLGCESFLQLLKTFAADRWGVDTDTRWQTNALGREHRWTYRGQVLPTDHRIEVEAVITAIDDEARRVVATGYLTVDGRTIYHLEDFSLEIAPERE